MQDALFEIAKPPYRRMTMDEVIDTKPNGLRAVGSFSGCGGSSLGLRMAGWSVPAAIEFVPAAVDTYRANSTGALVLPDDIRSVDGGRILSYLDLRPGELDLFEGSPPCSSFSAAGKRGYERTCETCSGDGERAADLSYDGPPVLCEDCGGTGRQGGAAAKKYSDVGPQRTDDLFDHWLRLVDELRPRAIVAENVPDMINGDAADYVAEILERLSTLGYAATAAVMNAAAYGTPQARRRLIFLGFRHDVGVLPRLPDPTTAEPYTLREALADVDPDDPDHAPFLAGSDMTRFAVGQAWEIERWLAGDRRGPKPDGRTYFSMSLPNLDKPCPTVTATASAAGAASVCHPTEKRKFTPAELKAIGGFPPDFVLTGTREQRCERIGRAVMPPLYRAVGSTIAEALR